MQAYLVPAPPGEPVGARGFYADALATATEIKSTTAALYLLDLMNSAAATTYVQIYFQPLASVTVGSTTPDLIIKLPTNGGSGFTKTVPFPVPVGGLRKDGTKGTGLTIAASSGLGNTVTPVAVAVTAVFV